MEIVYVPIGVPTFDLEEAGKNFSASIELLKSICPDVKVPSEMLLSIDKLNGFLDSLNPSLIILQNITFANAEYTVQTLSRTSCPVLLWTLREPKSGGERLKLNSLTGAFSAANAMHALGRTDFQYVFGSPDEDTVQKKIAACVDAVRIKEKLRHSNMASVGYTPQGFGFGRALDAEIKKTFGVNLICVEARELINKANSYEAEDLEKFKSEISGCCGIEKIPMENIERHLRLRKSYADFIEQNNISALASRCWPDFFVEYKTPVCSVLSFLNDTGVSAACEGDLYGALSMFIAQEICHTPVFFGDPVAMNETENTITYWHCGMAATKLSTKPELGVHPNRKIGPVMDFGCKASPEATVIRIGRKPDASFRMFIARGEITDAPKQYQGTSIVFKPKNPAADIVKKSVKDGWEPHYIIATSDIAETVICLSEFLGIEVCEF